MSSTPQFLLRAAAAAAVFSLPGCILVAAGVVAGATYGVIKYTENGATRDYQQPAAPTWEAALATLRELGYPVQEGVPYNKSRGQVKIDDVDLTVEPHTDTWSTVKIRIGTFDTEDNRGRARRVLDGIAQRLGESGAR